MSKFAEKVWKEAQDAMFATQEKTGDGYSAGIAIIDAALKRQRKRDADAAARAIATWAVNKTLQVKQRSFGEVIRDAILNAGVEE